MTVDISINYGKLEEITQEILTFKTALEEMQTAMQVVKSHLEESAGEAVDQLKEEHEKLEKSVKIQQEEISDLYDIFSGYNAEMSAIIGPLYPQINTLVDRLDIKANIKSIGNSVDDLEKEVRRRLTPNVDLGIDVGLNDEEKADERHNEGVIEALKVNIASKIRAMQELVLCQEKGQVKVRK